jgi:hypothetical protein
LFYNVLHFSNAAEASPVVEPKWQNIKIIKIFFLNIFFYLKKIIFKNHFQKSFSKNIFKNHFQNSFSKLISKLIFKKSFSKNNFQK